MKVSTSLMPGDQLPVLLERIERREKSARIRAVSYSLLPVALTVVLLGYTASSVRNAQKQVDDLKTEADDVVYVLSPEVFHAVGSWYEQFPQLTNEEVPELLERAAGQAAVASKR